MSTVDKKKFGLWFYRRDAPLDGTPIMAASICGSKATCIKRGIKDRSLDEEEELWCLADWSDIFEEDWEFWMFAPGYSHSGDVIDNLKIELGLLEERLEKLEKRDG